MTMLDYRNLREEAASLKNQGLDFRSIGIVLGLPESTVYGWLVQNKIPNRPYNIPLRDSSKILSPNLAYVLGVIYGDGEVVNNQLIRLRAIDKDFVLAFKNSVENWVGFHASRIYEGKNNGLGSKKKLWGVILSSREAASVLTNSDLDELLSADNKIKSSFLRGIFDSEGTVIASRLNRLRFATRKVRLYSTNKNLLFLVRKLLKVFGIESGLYLQPKDRSHIGKKRVYSIQISNKKNLEVYLKYIGFNISRKQNNLRKIIGSYKK